MVTYRLNGNGSDEWLINKYLFTYWFNRRELYYSTIYKELLRFAPNKQAAEKEIHKLIISVFRAKLWLEAVRWVYSQYSPATPS